MREKQATIRQILVITDGCSNVGVDPVEIAAVAHQQNIVVNVIGVVERGELGEAGRNEVMSIADAGGGLAQIVHPTNLAATAQMMTHQSMQMTLQEVVNQELLQLMGKDTEDLAPRERAAVMKVVDKLEEEVNIELVVVVDTSASMKEKMGTVREAIRDLALSMQARQGASVVAVLAFPGRDEESCKVVQPFSPVLDEMALESVYIARGGTPTGPALQRAVQMFSERMLDDDLPRTFRFRQIGE